MLCFVRVGELLSNKDFANVIGTLIGFSKKVGTIGSYGNLKDFNECNNQGYYTIAGGSDSSIANKCGIDYGLLFYIKGNDNGSYSLQFAFDMYNRKIVYRMTNSSVTWEQWVRIVGEFA